MGLNIRHSIVTAPVASGPGLTVPPPGAGLLPGVTRTTFTGDNTISVAGTTISNKNINNVRMYVEANNVTFSNCSISSNDYYGVYAPGFSGLTLDHCFITNATQTTVLTGANWTITNCEITRSDNGILFQEGTGLFQANYVHDLGLTTGAHVDGCQTSGFCNGVTFRGNWIQSWDTSCIFLKCDGGPITNILIEGNTLINEPGKQTAAAIYCNSVGSLLCTNVTIRNNRLQHGFNGAYVITDNSSPTMSGNVDYVTGAPVTF